MKTSTGNNDVIQKAAVNTGGSYGSSGLLPAADAEKFILMIQDDSSFLGRLDSEVVDRISGSISKLGVGSRLLRNYTEGNDNITGHEVTPVIGNVPYTCKYATLGSSISENWLKQNKEKENFEQLFMGQIAGQIKIDILDLAFNGDEATATTDKDYEFLHLNDGFLKQIKAGGHKVDGATISGGKFDKKMFYALRRAVPKKYRSPNFCWICSDDTYTDLSEYLSDRPTSLGDISVTKGESIQILGTSFATIPSMPDDVVLYADPKNLKVVYFGEIAHRKSTEGKEAIYKNERYYADHMALDFIIKEIQATGILINRGALTA